jgi:hypothetical protein
VFTIFDRDDLLTGSGTALAHMNITSADPTQVYELEFWPTSSGKTYLVRLVSMNNYIPQNPYTLTVSNLLN